VALFIENGKKATSKPRPEGFGIPMRLVRWVRDHEYADEDASLWLLRAMYESAPITHPEGNRRYGDLLLTVSDNRLVDLAVYEPQCASCNDTRRFIAYDPDGTPRSWPCPDCRVDKRQGRAENRTSNTPRR